MITFYFQKIIETSAIHAHAKSNEWDGMQKEPSYLSGIKVKTTLKLISSTTLLSRTKVK